MNIIFNLRKKVDRGFTILELLVVIAIIGLLSNTVISSVSTSRKKAQVTRAFLEAKELHKALELYVASNGRYPSNAECTPDSNTIQSYYENQFGTTTFYYFQRQPPMTPGNCLWTMASSTSAQNSHVLNVLNTAGLFNKNIQVPPGTYVYYGMYNSNYLIGNDVTYWCGDLEIEPNKVYLYGILTTENASYLPKGTAKFAEEVSGDYYQDPNSFCFYLN